MIRLTAIIVFFSFFSFSVNADSLSSQVTDAQNKKVTYKNSLELQQIIENVKESGRNHQSVKAISKYIYSDEFTQKQNKYTNSMRTLMDLNKEAVSESETENEFSNMRNRVVLFVSSSMPVHVLRNYAIDLSKINGIMVMRGFIGGISKIMPTENWIRKLILVDTNCDAVGCEVINLNVAFDPNMFTRNKIDRVPALIYEKNMDLSAYCKNSERSKANFVVYGDASLKGMLLELNRKINDSNINSIIKHM